MDLRERRSLLIVNENPDRKIDYVASLSGRIALDDQTYDLNLRYVPDRSVLKSTHFADYLNVMGKQNWGTPEDLAVTVLSDVNNELICRWVQVNLCSNPTKNVSGFAHSVVIEDRQPGWDNPPLLGRLTRV